MTSKQSHYWANVYSPTANSAIALRDHGGSTAGEPRYRAARRVVTPVVVGTGTIDVELRNRHVGVQVLESGSLRL